MGDALLFVFKLNTQRVHPARPARLQRQGHPTPTVRSRCRRRANTPASLARIHDDRTAEKRKIRIYFFLLRLKLSSTAADLQICLQEEECWRGHSSIQWYRLFDPIDIELQLY